MGAIAEAAWIAAGATAFVRLLYFTFERGQALHGYERALRAVFFHGGRLLRRDGRWRRGRPHPFAPVLRALYKPLGGCVYCTGVWAAIFASGELPPFARLAAAGFAFVWTALWLKIEPLRR